MWKSTGSPCFRASSQIHSTLAPTILGSCFELRMTAHSVGPKFNSSLDHSGNPRIAVKSVLSKSDDFGYPAAWKTLLYVQQSLHGSRANIRIDIGEGPYRSAFRRPTY